MLPAVAMAKVSMRLVPNQDPKKIGDLFEAYLKKVTPKTVELKITRMHGGKPWMTAFDNQFVQAAGRAIEQGFGKAPVFNREGGSIPVVSTFQEELGLPCVLFGVGLPDENAHAPDEKLDLGNFHNGVIASAYLYQEIAQPRDVTWVRLWQRRSWRRSPLLSAYRAARMDRRQADAGPRPPPSALRLWPWPCSTPTRAWIRPRMSRDYAFLHVDRQRLRDPPDLRRRRFADPLSHRRQFQRRGRRTAERRRPRCLTQAVLGPVKSLLRLPLELEARPDAHRLGAFRRPATSSPLGCRVDGYAVVMQGDAGEHLFVETPMATVREGERRTGYRRVSSSGAWWLCAAAFVMPMAMTVADAQQGPAGSRRAHGWCRLADSLAGNPADAREARSDVLDTPILPGSVIKAVTLVAAIESHAHRAGHGPHVPADRDGRRPSIHLLPSRPEASADRRRSAGAFVQRLLPVAGGQACHALTSTAFERASACPLSPRRRTSRRRWSGSMALA